MADYRDHYNEIRAAGAALCAASVDPPNKSEILRQQLDLPFPILCDTDRRIVQQWDIYNARKGGIAKPAVFIIDPNRTVRYSAIDSVATRVPASEIVRLLQPHAETAAIRRKVYVPRFAEWRRAFRNVRQS